MSRPWQFSEDGARSPFDRPAPNPSAQPPSFQINVNRQKSKKWTEAKNYNYDGDDWGGYDEYNEYGTYDDDDDDDDDEDGTESEPAPLPSAAALKHRSNSFDRGDEQRSFSAGVPITPQRHANAQSQSTSSAGRASQGAYDIRRDFTQPAHVPPPLNFRASRDTSPAHPPVPNITNTDSPSGATHPPRKSSLSGSIPTDLYSSPPAKPASSGTPTGNPLPFIRPADIYKRMQEEKEKDKERRPSLGPVTDGSESINASHQYGRQGFTVDNPVLARAIGASVAAEPAGGSSTLSAPEVGPVSDTLPQVSRVASAFGSEFWGASELSESLRLNDDSSVSANLKPTTGPELTVPQPEATQRSLQHQPSLGFRSVVHEAFDRHDDSPVPRTPISRDNSQSQNGSETSGISPIMSRVPSTAAAESRARAREASVPPIAEESSLPASPDLGQSQVVPRKPSPAQSQTHSRTTSGEGLPASYTPGYRRSLEPPSQESTPVRTPELEFTKRLSHPMAAETALHLPPEDTDPVKPSPADYSKRESDLADEASSSPDKSVYSVAAASHVARANFLQAHSPTLSTSPTFSRPASRSPSPGRQSPGGASRVQQLAGKFDNMHALSRTSSGLSIRSKSSVQSWERSEENLPLKRAGTFESSKSDKDELGLPEYDNADIKGLVAPARPEPTSVPSFRPHLPGEWVSYIDTPRHSKIAVNNEATPMGTEETTATMPSSVAPSGIPRPASPATEPVDLAPTTAKQKLQERDLSERESSPIDAVKAAGEALGTALMSSMGLGGGHQTRDFAEPEKSLEAPSAAPEQNRPSVGNVYLRPLAVDETASSVGSSVAPTPLPKDTPEGRGMQRSSGYFPAPVLRVGSDDHNLDSPEDMESDRLRKEIERSLTPQTLTNTENHEQIKRDQDALDGPANLRDHQEAEQLPAATTPDFSVPSVSVAPAGSAPAGIPTLLNKRFSWEQRAEKSEPLFAPEGAEPTEPRAPYERPISNQGLHIVNANISADSSAATTPVFQEPSNAVQESFITSQPVELEAAGLAPHQGLQPTEDASDVLPSVEDQSRDVSAISSPSIEHQPSQDDSIVEPPLERPIIERSGTGSISSIPTVTASSGGDTTRIPPFREILALKSSPERISKYNETRTQFAATDTGLSNWLSSTLASNPEHADLAASISSSGSAGSNAIGSIRQKPGAKIMQNARNLLPLRENASADTETAGSGGPQRKVSVGQSGAFQAKGKDFMKSAGVFGGKASVGAKGLFAKAKGKLNQGGNEKAISNDRNINGRQTTETIQRPSVRSTPILPATPSRGVTSPASEESRPVISGRSQAAIPENTINERDRQRAPTVGIRDIPRASSRTSNRLSTVFGRLREGSQNRPKSQTSSTIVSPFDKDPVAVDRDIRSPPVMMSPTETEVAPWTIPDEVEIKTPNVHRIGQNGRIGFLPSPAVETQMTLDQQDETEHGAVMQEVQQEVQQESQQDLQQESQLNFQPEDAPEYNQSEVDAIDSAGPSSTTRVGQDEPKKAINKTILAVETSEARLSAELHRVSHGSGSSIQQHEEKQTRSPEPATVEPSTAIDPLPSIVKPMGSVLRSPAARPSRFSDAYYPIDTKNMAAEPTFSPVSSLGPDAEDEIDNRKKEDGNYLNGVVSPVDGGEIQPMEQPVVSAPADLEEKAPEHHNTSQDQQPYTELNSVAPQQRPVTERKMSRSSLPSQQRPVESPKRINWNAPRSRRASQVLEPATEGVVTPHFGSRKNSIHGFGDFPINSGSYFTSDDLSAATASNLSSGFHGPVDGTLGMSSSSWVQRAGQASSLLMEDTTRGPSQNPQQQYGYLQRTASGNAPPSQEYMSQQHTYAQQPVTAGAPPPVRREDLQSNRFTPATVDPRQQSAEHPYTGEQSLPENGIYRGTYREENSTRSQAESKAPVDAARMDPSTVTNQQQTFASDEVPQATLQEQKEKRKSGFFGAFSRSSSISESSRLSSRGNTTATAADTSASRQPPQSQGYANPAISAALKARENTNSRGNTLRKVERSATTASLQNPEKKEGRFSRLGSIFGRRNSKAGKPPPVKPQSPQEAKKPNRLVKPMPISHSLSRTSASSTPVQRSRESLPIRNTTQSTGQGNVLSPPPPPSGLQAMYQHQRGYQPGAADLPQLPAAWSAPPPGGWYAPSGRPSSYTESERQQGKQREPTLPFVEPTIAGYSSPQQTTRRLHSEGFRREPRYMTASPGPGSVTNNAAAPRERYYASGGQAIPPGTVMADRVDTGWEQTMPPMTASHVATSGSAPRAIPRTNGQRPLSGSWQRQSSYGSDAGGAGPHFDNFSSYGTSPNARRHGSIGSDARMPNLTPTHSRTASFGAAPKDAYRMSSTFEGEQMLQRNFEQNIMQAQEAAMYGSDGGNGAYGDPSVNDGRTSASSSPYRSRGEAGGRYTQQQYPQRSNTSARSNTPGAGFFLPMPPARPISGNWQQVAAPGPGSPVGSLRQSRTPNESRAGSRTNSLVIIDEDYAFPDQSHAPSVPPISATSGPIPVSIPAPSPAQNVKTWGPQQGYAPQPPPPQIQSYSPGGRSYNPMWPPQQTQPQQQQQQQQPPTLQNQYMNYNANAERRRAERRGSGAYTQHAREQHTVERVGEPTQMKTSNHSGHF